LAGVSVPLPPRRRSGGEGTGGGLIFTTREQGRSLEHGIKRVASKTARRSAAEPLRARELRELGRERPAGRHVEEREPALERDAERGGQARLIAEIDDMERTAGREAGGRPCQRLAPRWDHRERVGDDDAIEARAPEERHRIEACRIRLRQRDALAKPGAHPRLARRVEHRGGYIQPMAQSTRIGLRQLDEVAPGAAADLEHARAFGRLERGDQAVTAEQIEFSARIVDMALPPIDAIHQGGGFVRIARRNYGDSALNSSHFLHLRVTSCSDTNE
jgi:hypothetical protein